MHLKHHRKPLFLQNKSQAFHLPLGDLPRHLLCHFTETEKKVSLLRDKSLHCSNLSQKTSSDTKRGSKADMRDFEYEGKTQEPGVQVESAQVVEFTSVFELLCDVRLCENRCWHKTWAEICSHRCSICGGRVQVRALEVENKQCEFILLS